MRLGPLGVALGALLVAPRAFADGSSPAPPESAAQAQAVVPQTKRAGVAVVLVGAAEVNPGKQARDLARASYASTMLRPELDEATVRVLAGGEPGEDARLKRLAGLRAGLGPDLSEFATQSSLDGLAAELSVTALVLLVPGATGPLIRIAHVEQGPSAVRTRLDPASITPTPKEGQPDQHDVAPVIASIERLVAPRPPPPEKPPALPAPAPKPGPRKEKLAKGKQAGPPPKPEAEDSSFFESPWFWVAVGGVAATGLTILIVSQVTTVDEGTVALKGKVLQ